MRDEYGGSGVPQERMINGAIAAPTLIPAVMHSPTGKLGSNMLGQAPRTEQSDGNDTPLESGSLNPHFIMSSRGVPEGVYYNGAQQQRLFTDGQAIPSSPMQMGHRIISGRQHVYYGGNVSMQSDSDHYQRGPAGYGDQVYTH